MTVQPNCRLAPVSEAVCYSAQSDLEYPSCPFCFCEDREEEYSFPPYAVVRCSNCDFFYLSPRVRVDIIREYYDGSYFESDDKGYTNYRAQERTLRATFRSLLSNLHKRNLTGGKLLEVGCAYGYLLEEATSFFAQRFGTDYSIEAVARARRIADSVIQGGIEQIPKGLRFDCIIATHVIEHVYNPREFLEGLATILNPGGSIVIAAPNMSSLWRVLMGRRWPFFKLPEHVCYFDQDTLKTFMCEAGLTDVVRLPFPSVFPLHLVAEKLNFQLPRFLNRINVWLPGTTVAMVGVLPAKPTTKTLAAGDQT